MIATFDSCKALKSLGNILPGSAITPKGGDSLETVLPGGILAIRQPAEVTGHLSSASIKELSRPAGMTTHPLYFNSTSRSPRSLKMGFSIINYHPTHHRQQ